MYLIINGARYSCTKRIKTADTVKYLSVDPAVEDISGVIQMYRNDGFLMSEDNTEDYQRKFHDGALLTITNAPEPVPVVPAPSLEERVAAIETAIEKGLSL